MDTFLTPTYATDTVLFRPTKFGMEIHLGGASFLGSQTNGCETIGSQKKFFSFHCNITDGDSMPQKCFETILRMLITPFD